MKSTNNKLKVVFLVNRWNYKRTFHKDDLDFLKSFADILNEGDAPDSIDEAYMKMAVKECEACISCWGTPPVSKAVLDSAASLKLIAHAAGTPKAIVTDDVWQRDVRVFTAAPIIAVDVAETVLGAIIYLQKRLCQYNNIIQTGIWAVDKSKVDDQKAYMKRINYRLTVGIIGASHVGKNLIRLLQPFGAGIKLYDPFVSDFSAKMMGVEKAALDELMSSCDVISVHAPNIPQTYRLIDKNMLSLIRDGALFVNTARGPIVDESALVEELKTGRFSAYIDVFDTEPLPSDNPFLHLENVLLSPHISGGHTVNGGFERGNYVIQQLFSYHTTGVLKDETVSDMIGIMA